MHNKFCIIDNYTLLSGSYNWTKNAQNHNENITIIKEDEQLISKFNKEFTRLFFADTVDYNNITKIIVRLETLKSVIKLEDEEDIEFQTNKIQKLLQDNIDIVLRSDIEIIIKDLKQNNYGTAIDKVLQILDRYKSITVYEDPRIPALRLELQNLQFQLVSVEDEMIDIEKLIRKFELQHDKILGLLILEILNLRQQILDKQAVKDKTKEAESQQNRQEYNDYKQNYEENKQKEIRKLTTEDEKKLKKAHRKAAMLCHPDKVPPELKKQAEETFNKLTIAYEENKLEEVEEILKNLQNSNWSDIGDKAIEKQNSIEILKNEIETIKQKLDAKLSQLENLRNNKTYKRISSLENWQEYFEQAKAAMKKEIEELKSKINELAL